MSFITILETLLIGPLKLIFEIIFVFANRLIGHPGLAIIMLSLIMNILVLPLYKRADAMQEQTRDTEAKLHDGVAHIKKTFSGDEQMMILQAYYRQNHYKPTDALNGSVSLLLEVPFFMAAYQFLSSLQTLHGASLGPIADLGAPDGLLVIGGIAINILPVIMTLVNVISSAIYLKGFPLKTKIQLYAMAGFFLVFLYTSPSGLVFYWTLNNVFSLVKTIFYKLKNPKKVLLILLSVAGLALVGYGAFFYGTRSIKRKLLVIGIGLVLQLPQLWSMLKHRITLPIKPVALQSNRKVFILGSMLLTVLLGALIPSAVIAASPQEFVDLSYFHHPLWFVLSAFCLAAGTFLVWMQVFYWLANEKGKAVFDRLIWILCGVMLVNYMFFGTDLGVISSRLQYVSGLSFSAVEQAINLAVILIVAVLMYVCITRWGRMVVTVLLTVTIALGGMSVWNIAGIHSSIEELIQMQNPQYEGMPNIQLSKTGKNVIVLMLDRAMGEYVPYMLQEKPELKQQFAGFTYYSNTISYAGATNMAAPALLGGYEYTPVEMNKRGQQSLVSKHNEAVKLMPVLFDRNGFDVTVCDPVLANYKWVSDLSIFQDYPDIKAYITKGKFTSDEQKAGAIQSNHRNFFCFSVMKTMPLAAQRLIYNGGWYNRAATSDNLMVSNQLAHNMSMASGVDAKFLESYNVLCNLSGITTITNGTNNTFLFLSNDATHEPNILQTPNYTVSGVVNNTQYDRENADRFVHDGRELIVNNAEQMGHYHANMASLLQLGQWFDYLRENDIYDNTRIILVSDHGRNIGSLEELMIPYGAGQTADVEWFFPLLMVKDFNSTEFTVSDAFMTNADVPMLAMKDLIKNPVNPFTGKPITSDAKTAHPQYIMLSEAWQIELNNGSTFLPGAWASVENDLWDRDNWKIYPGSWVLTDHAAPQ